MMFRTNQERMETVKRLAEYIDSQPDGEELPWIRIEADTGIPMTDKGKDMFRQALRRRPYEAIRGVGIRLSCADTALTIAHSKLVAVDHSVKRADRTQKRLQERHLDEMKPREQQKMLMLASFFGAIRSIAKNATQKVFAPAAVEQK